jgi:acyl transferase domain-containing protein
MHLPATLLEPDATSRVHSPELSQPLCTALQIAIVDLLRVWGVSPVATVGHSSGKSFHLQLITIN